MLPLKEATHNKHKEAERMPFNVKMFKGELTKEQYGKYLLSQLEIFSAIEENFEMPHEGLRRKKAVMGDLKSLGIYQLEIVDNGTLEYAGYLKGLDQETMNAHIYLNYLAIMFGGQMMKRVTPGEGNMYEFEDMNESAAHIRAIQKDEWADEVNKGFDFMIEIFKELEKMSYYKLKERIFYHSEKFKELIESQSGVKEIHTDDYGWENYRYENDKFRLAHVERYSHNGLEVVHITAFPKENSKAPIFGFDVVGYENEEEQRSKISGVFIDWSPTMYEENWHDSTWNKDRKLPVWATVFSESFIAVRPTEDEYEKIFEVGFKAFQKWIDKINSDEDLTDDVEEIEQIIENQNTYCEHQASNKRTMGALTTNIGKEKAEYFMKEVLFPKIKV